MKYALISSSETTSYISSWVKVNNQYQPILSPLGLRVAQTASSKFDVHSSLIWKECSDNVSADLFYYDSADQLFKQVPDHAPHPESNTQQVDVSGAENF